MTGQAGLDNKLPHIFLPLFAAALLLGPLQARPQAAEEDTVEEIVVTGSRIKRRDFASPSPIATLDEDAITASGQFTLEETLNRMPQVVPDYNRAANSPGDGTARINLRGFGAGRTLVLLNGRRVAPSGVGSSVDLHNIPQSLIDRVEIITGGASTVYGSDAIAGVVNFITRSDFSGLAIDAGYTSSAENDARAGDLNLSWGHNFGRGNFTFYGGVHERESLYASARPLTRHVVRNDDETGTLSRGGSFATPSGLIFVPGFDYGTGGSSIPTFDANGLHREFVDPDDRYNYAPANYLQTPLTRYHGGLFATLEIGGGYELYVESQLTRTESAFEYAPVPALDFFVINTDNPVLEADTRQFLIDNYTIAPGFAGFFGARRLSEIGSRMVDVERQYWRSVVGIRGDLDGTWDIDGWITYTDAEEKALFGNDGSASRFLQGLLVDPATGQCFDPSNGCVAVDMFGPGRISAEAADYLRITNMQNDTERVQKLAAVVVTGAPWDTWAGPLDLAFGLEWRSDEASFKADDVLFTGDTLGFSGQAPVDGTESVVEVYGETVVPLLNGVRFAENLQLELGLRYSEYDLAGGVWTYKLGGDWQINDSVRLRSMHQKSVRAPNNIELFEEQYSESGIFIGDNSSRDPCSASNNPASLGYAEKCIIQGLPAGQVGTFEASTVPVDFVQGGNPELVPEEATTWTVGVVLTPQFMQNWNFTVDYYQMEVTDSIGGIDAMAICFDPSNSSHLFCENIRRDVNAGGNIVEFYEPVSNRGLIATRGIDTQIDFLADLPAAWSLWSASAQLNFNVYWTHALENQWQLNPVTEVIECNGFFGFFCSEGVTIGVGATLPENRVTSRFSYIADRYSITLSSRWIDGSNSAALMEAEFYGWDEPLLAIPSIGSKHYLDLGVTWMATDALSLRIGVTNLTDTDAPMMAEQGPQYNTDTLLYDIYGRSFYLSLSARFFE